jgi:hypothetical protein
MAPLRKERRFYFSNLECLNRRTETIRLFHLAAKTDGPEHTISGRFF